jgi:hypothetical protein
VKFLQTLADGKDSESLPDLLALADEQMRLAAKKTNDETEVPSQEKE